MHRFVAIESLTFFKNARLHFIAQDSSQYLGLKKSVCKQDQIFPFLHIRKFQRKNCFLYINGNENDYHQQNTMCALLYIQKKCEMF